MKKHKISFADTANTVVQQTRIMACSMSLMGQRAKATLLQYAVISTSSMTEARMAELVEAYPSLQPLVKIIRFFLLKIWWFRQKVVNCICRFYIFEMFVFFSDG